ncbi:hypothetical protein GUITHDRAFT_94796 [Guillardia theta CCMP2712]|uniref:Large ribosomal subunit protein uL29m n=1 Tax=Guillardia theta (strain CCMP2712) TaxID=905079 RepID=L1JB47_GUITC|nr:hypothetical protein GUITHDRAFT_94796 [Guillardia theta CCMP2712]EKX45324.1 hypothetical protein GUITHDRAFT_94796 [Guillardia theta CCMP2712]|eukprot:XP_005832304.1 hypothetical protein GUITHDRAFT_94796 [Guillardia theta CCMP2712]
MALMAVRRGGWREGWKMMVETRTRLISHTVPSPLALSLASSSRGMVMSNGAAASSWMHLQKQFSASPAFCGRSPFGTFSPFSVFATSAMQLEKASVSQPHGERRSFSTTSVKHKLDDFFTSMPAVDEDGNPIYPAVGRSWRAEELRQKSFEDLHKIWWLCLKERNSLALERHEARARGVTPLNPSRFRKLRKTMARIRVVLGERSRMKLMLKKYCKRHGIEAMSNEDLRKFIDDLK